MQLDHSDFLFFFFLPSFIFFLLLSFYTGQNLPTEERRKKTSNTVLPSLIQPMTLRKLVNFVGLLIPSHYPQIHTQAFHKIIIHSAFCKQMPLSPCVHAESVPSMLEIIREPSLFFKVLVLTVYILISKSKPGIYNKVPGEIYL